MRQAVRTHNDLEVYQQAFQAAMRIFELTKNFPTEERYSLTDQIRRSSRSVCANLPKRGEKGVMKDRFCLNLTIPKGKLPKPKPGLNLPLNAIIWTKIPPGICIKYTIM